MREDFRKIVEATRKILNESEALNECKCGGGKKSNCSCGSSCKKCNMKEEYLEEKHVHIPEKPDTMQSVCTKCGKEIEPSDRGSSDKWVLTKEEQLQEKWKGEHEIKKLDKYGKEEQSLSELKKKASALRSKPSRTASQSKELKRINFAIRARTGWGKVSEEEKFTDLPLNEEEEISQWIHEEVEDIVEAMTKKHFQMVADMLKEIPDMDKRQQLANHHSRVFAMSNPRYKKELFHKAAGTDPNKEN